MLVLAAAFGARPAAAAPFAYVTNQTGTVSVIDMATNMVVGSPIPVGNVPKGVAVTPDGKHVYETNGMANGIGGDNTVSVIDTATNTVVGSPIPVGTNPFSIAVTPDGKHAYVTNTGSGTVSVIDTASNTVVAAVLVGGGPLGVAITSDGKHAYVMSTIDGTKISVIDTATNMVVGSPIVVGRGPFAVAITPDGTHVYVTNELSGSVSVIDTATNMVVATVVVGSGPEGVAVTPDGKHAYVTIHGIHLGDNIVQVIDTASNTVVGSPIVVGGLLGGLPFGVAIGPPPPGVPFAAFNAKLAIDLDKTPNQDSFKLQSSFTLGSASNGINPPAEAVTLQAGTFSTTIPPGSFTGTGFGPFTFKGVINGVALQVTIKPTGAKRFAFHEPRCQRCNYGRSCPRWWCSRAGASRSRSALLIAP